MTLEKLTQEIIFQLKAEGRELCGYVRNPVQDTDTKVYCGKCALNGVKCLAIFTEHKQCSNCFNYWIDTYGRMI